MFAWWVTVGLVGHLLRDGGIFISKVTVCCPTSAITVAQTSLNQLGAITLPSSRASQSHTAICCCRVLRHLSIIAPVSDHPISYKWVKMMYPNKLITQLAFFSFNRFIIAARFPTFPSQESEQRNRPSRLHTFVTWASGRQALITAYGLNWVKLNQMLYQQPSGQF